MSGKLEMNQATEVIYKIYQHLNPKKKKLPLSNNPTAGQSSLAETSKKSAYEQLNTILFVTDRVSELVDTSEMIFTPALKGTDFLGGLSKVK